MGQSTSIYKQTTTKYGSKRIKENPTNFIKLKEYIQANMKNTTIITFYHVFAIVKANKTWS